MLKLFLCYCIPDLCTKWHVISIFEDDVLRIFVYIAAYLLKYRKQRFGLPFGSGIRLDLP